MNLIETTTPMHAIARAMAEPTRCSWQRACLRCILSFRFKDNAVIKAQPELHGGTHGLAY
jgi:hypothetical protein